MELWICPKCGKKLKREAHVFCCEAGHCYDIAKSGYVNLLLANEKNAKVPGDNREMVAARRSFLETDSYLPLARRVAERMTALTPPGGILLDAGCGEGYYTEKLGQALKKRGAFVYGTDISKYALERAAKHSGLAGVAVASSYRLPVASGEIAALTTIFAPVAPAEFCRVLAPGGMYCNVTAGARHLIELKQILYDSVYENLGETEDPPGFERVDGEELTYSFSLTDNQAIRHLFTMTPYYYTTPKEGPERLQGCEELELTADFVITVYRKK